jgi:hypothetical protein
MEPTADFKTSKRQLEIFSNDPGKIEAMPIDSNRNLLNAQLLYKVNDDFRACHCRC